jgi:hypothetical protein
VENGWDGLHHRRVTALAHTIRDHVRAGDLGAARRLLPDERPYPVPDGLPHLPGAGGVS